jgi:hypothetical protein
MNWFEWKPERKERQKPKKKGEQKKTVPASYLGMSTNQIITTQRLKFYWSVLGDCIEGRKAFVFKCTDTQEAEELKILTFSLVYQINDRWEVDLDGLELRADPPVEKKGGVVKKLEYSCLEKTTELRKCD